MLSGEDEKQLDETLNELELLLATLGVASKGRVVQKRQKLIPKSLLGTGKVEEIRELAEVHQAEYIVFDRQLSPPQVRNLEEMTGLQVMDRTGVILEIFAKHARSNQAKTQVEIAKLEYMLPRLAGAWSHFSRQTGGRVKARGMGEKQIEIDRRRAREKISRLHKQLDQIAKERKLQRKARANELKVALVGYTNSGKSTLMNALTKAQTIAKDELFATLDTNVKTIDPTTRPKILLTDTVGFIRNLPHSLVASFKSTLDEVLEADLLLHIVDISHDHYKDHIITTDEVLTEIGAVHVPVTMVFNKADQLDDRFLAKILRQGYPGCIVVSALSPQDMTRLREHIYKFFEHLMVEVKVIVPADDQAVLSFIHKTCNILDSDYSQEGVVYFKVKTSKSVYSKLIPYLAEHPHDSTSH